MEDKEPNKAASGEDAQPKTDRARKLEDMFAELRKKAHEVYIAVDLNKKREAAEEVARIKPELAKRILLLLIDDDWSNETGFDKHTTQEELMALRKDVTNTEGGMDLYRSYRTEWNGLRKYARHTKTTLLYPYLLEVARLFKMINDYKILQNTVKAINVAYAGQYYALQMQSLDETKLTKEQVAEKKEIYTISTQYLDELTRDLPKQIICDTSKINPTPYKIRVTDEREIWAEIKKQAKRIAKKMAELKAFDLAALEHANNSETRIQHLPFFFERLWEWMPNNTQERLRFNDDEKYYKGFLNDKVKKGYEPTEEDIKWALIPDYNEIKPDKEAYKEARLIIRDYTTIY